ncbi:MAG: ABC transporter ATP-binding protein [Armatimonadetes bacterium]|nr:ABC transporter ATP-binding protein [Armatimonadota bacterium]
MLRVDGLVKDYRRLRAVDHLSFAVHGGEILGLLGPNGAGKTTVLRCVAGIVQCTAGSIVVDGHDLARDEELAKAALGFVPEVPHPYEMLTVAEHLEFVARAYAKMDGFAERADDLLTRFGLAEKRRELVLTLSKGMRQKMTIACALIHEPRLLMLDEPLVGIDPRGQREVTALLRQHRDAGGAVLISTHILASAEELCDRILILNRGRKVAEGDLAALQEQSRTAYVLRSSRANSPAATFWWSLAKTSPPPGCSWCATAWATTINASQPTTQSAPSSFTGDRTIARSWFLSFRSSSQIRSFMPRLLFGEGQEDILQGSRYHFQMGQTHALLTSPAHQGFKSTGSVGRSKVAGAIGACPSRTMLCAGAALFAYTVLLANVGTLLAVLITFHGERVKLLPGGVKAAFVALAAILATGWANGSAGAVVDTLQSASGTVICLPAALTWQFMAAGVLGAPAYAAVKLGVLYLLAGLSWLAVVRRPENLYEPSTDSAVFWYDVRQAMKTGSMASARALMLQRRRTRFRPGLSQLAPFGRHAGVLLWRNVVLALRSGRSPALAFVAVTVLLPLGVALGLRRVGEPELARYCPLMVLYLLFVANTVMLRAHQGELQRANLLRPFPLPAWHVVLCQTIHAPALWLPALAVGFGVLVLAAPGVEPQLCVALLVGVPPLVWLLSIYGFGLSLGFSDPQNSLQNLVAGVLWIVGTGVLLVVQVAVGVALWMYGCAGLVVGAAAAALSGALALPALALAAAAYRRYDPTD